MPRASAKAGQCCPYSGNMDGSPVAPPGQRCGLVFVDASPDVLELVTGSGSVVCAATLGGVVAASCLAAATARRMSVLMSPDVATISCSINVALLTMSPRCSTACSRMLVSPSTFVVAFSFCDEVSSIASFKRSVYCDCPKEGGLASFVFFLCA